MRVMRDPGTVANNRRFIEVQLTNDEDRFIILAIDVTNLYVVAYRVGDQCWFLNDNDYPSNAPPGSSVFLDIPAGQRRRRLEFSGNYGGGNHTLQSFGGHRENINLGMTMLNEVVELLLRGDAVRPNERARAFIIIIQKVSEAVRFEYIENQVVYSMPLVDDVQYFLLFRPDMHMLSLENNWSDLSEQIQVSQTRYNRGFARTLVIHDRAGQPMYVDSLSFSLFSAIRCWAVLFLLMGPPTINKK
ncbi:hypothetical protein Tsubulata_037204 [Turnera subulata]|uniref:rRNA N-glycosylase n=1 Tax=Turnera subulata TaxID=218843 RepID=A0A9Q0JEV8_9ROSI|nr:hypothetical protein Tsubulata_037204 [Turnera subulata]